MFVVSVMLLIKNLQKKMKHFIKENTWLTRGFLDFGWGNGYILIEESNPLHGKGYDDIMDLVHVNQELTFAALVDKAMIENWPELSVSDLGMWCIGWDSAHHNQNLSNYPKEVVELETEELKQRLEEYNP